MNFSVKIPNRIDFLLIVRGVAAISVIYWHLGGYLTRDEYFASFFIVPGSLAVWIFFMMSGYLVGHGLIYGRYQQTFKDIRRFWFNRLLRIYPIFITVSFVAILISNPIVNLDFISKELLMMQFEHSYSLSGVFWTLGVEMQFYLLAPLMVFSYRAIFRKYSENFWILYLITLIPLIIVLIWKQKFLISLDLRNIIGNLSQFAVGIVMAGYKNKILSTGFLKNNITLFLIAILTVLLIVSFNHNYALNIVTIIFTHIIGIGLIMLHILLEEKKLPSNFLIKTLMILGVLSYGIYAWHGLLVINNFLVDNVLLHTIGSITLAYITYKLIEQPILKFKKI